MSFTAQDGPRRLGGAALTVAVHGAILAAFLLYPAIKVAEHYTTVHVRNIPLTPPPEPIKTLPEVEPDMKLAPPTAIDRPEPRIKTPVEPRVDLGPPLPLPQGDIPLPRVGSDTTGQPTFTLNPPIKEATPPPAPKLVEATRDSRFARDFQPPYPPALERAGTEGSVTVKVRIGADGRVKEVVPVRSDAPAFLDATRRQALARWRFRPATRDGVAVESWQVLTVTFRIGD